MNDFIAAMGVDESQTHPEWDETIQRAAPKPNHPPSETSVSGSLNRLTRQSRGFVDHSQLMDVTEKGESRNCEERDASIRRVASKLNRSLLYLAAYRDN